MPRVPEIANRDQVPAPQRQHYDSIVASRGSVGPPYTVLLHSPDIAARIGHLIAYCRFESSLPEDLKELAICAVAREMDCNFEWAAHEEDALKAGVRLEVIDAIKYRKSIDALTEHEAQVVTYVRQLLRPPHKATTETFNSLKERLDVSALVELTGLIGAYAALACSINAFEIVPPPDSPTLPE